MDTFKILLITGKTLGKHIDTFNAGERETQYRFDFV
jgi:hypothetical protein